MDTLQDSLRFLGFLQEAPRAQLQGAVPQVRIGQAGEKQQGNLALRVSQRLGHRQTVHVTKSHIENHQIRLEAVNLAQNFRRLMGRAANLQVAGLVDQRGQPGHEQLMVVDDVNAAAPTGSLRGGNPVERGRRNGTFSLSTMAVHQRHVEMEWVG